MERPHELGFDKVQNGGLYKKICEKLCEYGCVPINATTSYYLQRCDAK